MQTVPARLLDLPYAQLAKRSKKKVAKWDFLKHKLV
jgi:hypothetical protein